MPGQKPPYPSRCNRERVRTPTEPEATTTGISTTADHVSTVDPRAPRFGQAITAIGFGTGVFFDRPILVFAVSLVLLAAVVSGWRLDLYATLWRRFVVPVVGPPPEREAAAPHRFARVLGAVGGLLASGLLLVELPLGGYAIAVGVALLAGLAATTGLCVGCRLYGQVRRLQRAGVI